jgi:hypothetical protein
MATQRSHGPFARRKALGAAFETAAEQKMTFCVGLLSLRVPLPDGRLRLHHSGDRRNEAAISRAVAWSRPTIGLPAAANRP